MSAWIPPIAGESGRRIDAGLVLEDAWDAWSALVDHRKWAKQLAIFSVMRQEFRRHAYEPFRLPVMRIAARAQMSRTTALPLLGEAVGGDDKKRGSLWDVHWLFQHLEPAAGNLGPLWSVNHPIMFRGYPLANDPDPELVAALLGVPLRAMIRAREAQLVARSEGEIARRRVLSDDLSSRFTGKAARQILVDVALLSDLGEGPRDSETLSGAKHGQNRATNRGKSRAPSLLTRDEDEIPSSEGPEEGAGLDLDDDVAAVLAAIEAKTNHVIDGPRLIDDLCRVVGRSDVETMLAAVAAAPADYQPPYVVKYLRRVADGRIPLLGRRPDDERPPAATVDVAGLVRYARTLLVEGEPVPGQLRAQLEVHGAWSEVVGEDGRIKVCDEVPA